MKIKGLPEDKKRLISNFFSLSVLQGVNLLLPLIVLPYLIRVIGVEKFGLIVFAQTFIQYFVLFTDYGFNLSATRGISVHRRDKEKVSEIFSSVIFIKLVLMILGAIILFIIVFSIQKFAKEWLVYCLMFGVVVGNVLFPVWFFQGMERMKYITFLNILAKVIFTVAIFVFIREPSDYVYVPILFSLGFITAGMSGLQVAVKKFGVKLRVPTFESMVLQLREGWHIFVSTISVNFYKINSIFILGLFASSAVVGYYSIIKKLVDFVNQFAAIASQTIYPYISKNIKLSFDSTVAFLKRVGLIILSFTAAAGVLMLLLSKTIVSLLAGEPFSESVLTLQLLAFVPLVIGINVPAVQILLGHGFDRDFSRIVMAGALIDVVLNFSLVPLFSYIGSCTAVIVAEIFVTVGLYVMVSRRSHLMKSSLAGA